MVHALLVLAAEAAEEAEPSKTAFYVLRRRARRLGRGAGRHRPAQPGRSRAASAASAASWPSARCSSSRRWPPPSSPPSRSRRRTRASTRGPARPWARPSASAVKPAGPGRGQRPASTEANSPRRGRGPPARKSRARAMPDVSDAGRGRRARPLRGTGSCSTSRARRRRRGRSPTPAGAGGCHAQVPTRGTTGPRPRYRPCTHAICDRDQGLRKAYGDVEAVRGISFSVAAGEVFCLLGPNGAGKTTTTEILEGYRARSAGEVASSATTPRTASGRCASASASCCRRPPPRPS